LTKANAMKQSLTLLIIFCTIQVFGQQSFKNLDEYLNYVTVNNPALGSENFNREMSESRVRAAWSSLLPQVRAFGSLDNNIHLPVQLIPAQIFGGREGEFREIKFGTRYNASYGVEASMPVINVSTWKNVQAAKLADKASDFQYEDKKLSTIENAASAYYFALLSNEAVKISAELLSAADSLLKAAQVRLTNGTIETLDFNRVKALYIDTEQQYQSYVAAQQKNLNSLKITAGLNLADTVLLSESLWQLATKSSKVDLEINTNALPAYQMFSYRQMQAHQELKRQQAKIFPELSIYARYTKQSFSNTSDIIGGSQPWYDISVAGLRAEWLLFTGFNRQSQIKQAHLRSQQSELELKNYILKTDKELEDLRINHELAGHQVAEFSEQYKLNSESYKIAGVKYSEGVYTIDQYVTIYQELVRSQNQYLNSLANFLMYESIIQSKNKFQ